MKHSEVLQTSKSDQQRDHLEVSLRAKNLTKPAMSNG